MRALLALAVCSLVFCACEDSSVVVAPWKNIVTIGSNTTSDFRLVVNATSSAVTLNSVTLHLLTGENIGGGNMITFPQAGLTSLFGSTVVQRGVSQIFVFHPPFTCTGLRPCTVRAEATLTDGSGRQQTTSSVTTMP